MAIVTDSDALRECVEYFLAQPEFVFDVETIGPDRAVARTARVVWVSLSAGGRTDTIPMGHPNGELVRTDRVVLKSGQRKLDAGKSMSDLRESDFSRDKTTSIFDDPPDQLDRLEVFGALQPLFFGPALKIGHNIKFDLHAVAKYYDDVRPSGPYFDTLVASWLPDVSRRGRLSLEECYARECEGQPLEKEVGKNIELHSFSEVAKYSMRDSEATWELYLALRHQLVGPMRHLMDLEMEVLHPVLEMEATGVLVDVAMLSDIDAELRMDIDVVQSQVYLAANRIFNIRSNREKQSILYSPKSQGGFGFTGVKVIPSSSGKASRDIGPTDWAVDHESLERMSRGQTTRADFVRHLLAHAAKTKLHGTYVLPYRGGTRVTASGKEKEVAARLGPDNRIYAQFVQTGAESGRFSSRDPNLQNIPSRTAEGKRLREIFVADPGCSLVVADYSQIEPRIIASLSGDKTMIDTYRDGGDVYQAVADKMVVSRATGKELVLSIAYGVGADRISIRIDCTPAEARELMDFFDRKFPSISQHRHTVINRARTKRYAETVLGRRRPLPAIVWKDRDRQAAAERQAYNHLIQGSAADVMKIALVNIHASLPDEATMLMTVHDEVVVQAPEDLVEQVSKVVKTEMEGARPRAITVPLIADVSHGPSWGKAKAG